MANCVREIVVPSEYRTPNNSLFKARALHYCLSTNINILSRDDWIVHLDEETLLTEGVIHGIVDFISKPDSNIGQGVITYAGCGIENWVTTLLDGVRVAIDHGLFRFGLEFLKIPVFGFKGSFVVVKTGIEQQVGFDFGPKECIAEDLRFALTAWSQGYKFDFIHGIMKEKSPFSISDYMKQRKRWFIGHYHIIWSNTLPLHCKIFLLPMNIVNMFLWTNIFGIILSQFVPTPLMKWQLLMYAFLTVHILFMLVFGNFKSFCYKRYSLCFRIFISFFAQLMLPVLMVVEPLVTLQGLRDRNKISFDIVKKETRTSQISQFQKSKTIEPGQDSIVY
ncbi:Beta-1 [Mactra antiquata]